MIEGNDAAAASEFGSREVVTRSVVVGCFGSSSGTIAGFQNREAVQGFPSCSREELVISSQDLEQQMQVLLCRVIDRQKDKRMQLLMGRRKAL
ncbi:unnamed protein product [Sphagnum jensenii]